LTAQGPEGAQGRVLLAKPMTFMNLSGEFVASLSRYLKIPAGDVLVVCDDISLPLGRLRLRPFGSSGGQRGLESVLSRLGTQEVPRLRLGVGPLPPEADAADFVLDRFRPDEAEAADAMVSRACEALRFACGKGLEAAMNAFNPA
jgi:PTH1 family peptidyl-tRNA hydrolase